MTRFTAIKSSLLTLIVTLSFFSLSEAYEECNLTGLGYDPTLLNTKSGKLKGACYQVPIDDPDQPDRVEQVFYWLSIPYAQPPINELRFKKPKPIRPWSEVKNATQWPNTCISDSSSRKNPTKNVSESEDCLYLNIYAPSSLFKKENIYFDLNGINYKNKAPILFYIHAGRFVSGSSSEESLEFSINVGLSNIIYITFNYRLGPLGFMHVAGTDIVGNQGFLDQHLALKWVYENAESFGGDPNRITISGTSAGAMFCGYHLLHRPSWPFFKNVYLNGGSILYSAMEFRKSEEATRRSLEVLNQLGCAKNLSSNDLVRCAQKQNASTLYLKTSEFFNKSIINGLKYASELNFNYMLVLDNDTFKKSVKEYFTNNELKRANIYLGNEPQEGGILVDVMGLLGSSSQNQSFAIDRTTFVNFINDFYLYFPYYPYKPPSKFIDDLIALYTKGKNVTNYLNILIQILTDEIFICPYLELAKVYSKSFNDSKVFFYTFDHRSSSTIYPKEIGVVHGADAPYFYSLPLIKQQQHGKYARKFASNWPPKFTFEEKIISKRFITYLSNFIKFNDPNIFELNVKNKNDYPHWPSFSAGFLITTFFRDPIISHKENWLNALEDKLSYDYQHLIFQLNRTFVSSDFSDVKCGFWKDFNLYHI